MSDGPLFVYGNWASYDELSDSVPLDESLAMRQLDHLLRLRREGVRFDAYLMDAFWFARDGAYRTWRKPHWPDGPDRWLDACHRYGLLPGMWFTANTLFHLDLPPKWADSIDDKDWGLCLFAGGFLGEFWMALDEWYRRGVRLFKFDFAEFKAVPTRDKGKLDPQFAYRANVGAFQGALREFKRMNPEAILLGYNGFEERECMDRSDRGPGRYIDPAWLEVLDSVYCGDPRPSDLPQTDFWRSVDIYSDCMTRLFESSGIPLDKIDNCGFMAGDTGTCYWRGKAGWRAMLALSLARGGRIHVAYGDLGLFDQTDAKFWASLQELYAPAMRQGGTRSVGGWPGAGETYGWLSSTPDYDLATVVNPSMEEGVLDLPDSEAGWSALTVGADPTGRLRLGPGELAILISAKEGGPPGPPIDLGDKGRTRPMGAATVAERKGPSPLVIDLPAIDGPTTFQLTITQVDKDGQALRNYPSEGDEAPFQVRLLDGAANTRLPPMFGRKIWSGISWWVVDFRVSPSDRRQRIEIASPNTHGPVLSARLTSGNPLP